MILNENQEKSLDQFSDKDVDSIINYIHQEIEDVAEKTISIEFDGYDEDDHEGLKEIYKNILTEKVKNIFT